MPRNPASPRRRAPLSLALLLLIALPARGEDEAVSVEAPDAPLEGSRATAKDPEVEEIVIPGRADAIRMEDATSSTVSFGGDELEALGIQDASDLAAHVPNLEVRIQGATSPLFFIRGIGLSDFAANAPGAVAVYVDGVPRNTPARQVGIPFDLARIDVLRGPQGSGPNRNASAGTIRYVSQRPTGDASASLRTSFGNYEFEDYEAHVETPLLADRLALRTAFRLLTREGYAENGCAGAPAVKVPGVAQCGEFVGVNTNPFPSRIKAGLPKDVNDLGRWAGRGQLRWVPRELPMEWLFNVHGSRIDEDSRLGQAIGTRGTQRLPDGRAIGGRLGAPVGFLLYTESDIQDMRVNIANKLRAQGLTGADLRDRRDLLLMKALAEDGDSDVHRGDYNLVGDTELDTWGGLLSGEIELDDFTFRTRTGYDAYERSILADNDFTPNRLFEERILDRAWQATQDLEAEWHAHDTLVLRLGAFGLYEEIDSKTFGGFSLGVGSRKYTQEQLSLGTWAEFSWDFHDDFTLEGGARYNWQRDGIEYGLRRLSQAIERKGTKTWDHPTGYLSLTYRAADVTELYAKFSRGWKAGFWNATANLLKGITPTDPERVDALEIGVRSELLEGRIALEGALFYYRYEDFQVLQIDQDFGSLPETEVINASDAENYGGEIQLTLEPIDGFVISARGAWLESQFLDFSNPQLVEISTSQGIIIASIDQDYAGNRLINSPQFSASLTASWALDLGRFGTLTPRYDGSWTDDVYFDATEGRGLQNLGGDLFLPDDTIGQKAYWVHNARLSYRLADDRVEIAGWVRNFTDETYRTGGFDYSLQSDIVIHFIGEPRTYGMDVRILF